MRRTLKLAACLTLPPLLLFGYYAYYEMFARRLIFREHVFYQDANAIKHAYAAMHLFTLFDQFFDADTAEKIVLDLGYANERMEQAMHLTRDSTAEVLKDLSNNQIGLTAAKWYAAQPHSSMSLRELSIQLAQQKILKLHEESVSVAPADAGLKHQAAVDAAIAAFEKTQPELVAHTRQALGTTAAHLRQQPR